MEQYPWRCCRFCLSVQTLNPIFREVKYAEKYTITICEATGIMVRENDCFPKEICDSCVSFINKSIKFRRKCTEIQKSFENKVNIMGIDIIGSSESNSIDISHLIDDEYTEYDDNITLDHFQYNNTLVRNAQSNKEDKKFNLDDRVHDINIDIKIEPTNDEHVDSKLNIKDCANDKLLDVNKSKRRAKRKMKDSTKEDSETGDSKKDKNKEDTQCKYCHKILSTKMSLRSHHRLHTGCKIVCEHCGKKFNTRRYLLMHCKAKHGYEKTDKCSFCDYRGSNPEQVKIHERLHTGEKPFACAQCDARFHRQSSYLQHVAIHLPDKTVQCDQCPARFKSVTLMRIHQNRHREPRYTYSCTLCGGTFARRYNVVRHLVRVHADRADTHIQRHDAC